MRNSWLKQTIVAMRIREARAFDATALVDLGRTTYTETFGDGYPPEDLAYYLDTAYSEEDFARQIAEPSSGVWVLEDEELGGYITCGDCKLPSDLVQSGDGEIKRIYVLQKYQRGGWGAKLLETALDWLIETGRRTIYLGVWSQNYAAQRLYERYGFSHCDEYEFIVGKTRDREFIYRKLINRQAN